MVGPAFNFSYPRLYPRRASSGNYFPAAPSPLNFGCPRSCSENGKRIARAKIEVGKGEQWIGCATKKFWEHSPLGQNKKGKE